MYIYSVKKASSSLGRPVPLLREELPHPTPTAQQQRHKDWGVGTAAEKMGVTRRKGCPVSASQGAVLAGGLVCSVSTVLGEYRFSLLCIELKLLFSP